jgi:hypothetical protein
VRMASWRLTVSTATLAISGAETGLDLFGDLVVGVRLAVAILKLLSRSGEHIGSGSAVHPDIQHITVLGALC